MSSWFGGPASTSKHRKDSDAGTYIRTSSRRESSPQRYFVRPKSPSAQSTRSLGSFFGRKHSSSSSYYKRRPRDGFISRMIAQIKKYLRDIIEYAKNNPLKVIMLVLPLVTGGALAGIMKSVGISLPAGLAGFMGAGNKAAGMSGAGAQGFGIEQAMSVAKMFM